MAVDYATLARTDPAQYSRLKAYEQAAAEDQQRAALQPGSAPAYGYTQTEGMSGGTSGMAPSLAGLSPGGVPIITPQSAFDAETPWIDQSQTSQEARQAYGVRQWQSALDSAIMGGALRRGMGQLQAQATQAGNLRGVDAAQADRMRRAMADQAERQGALLQQQAGQEALQQSAQIAAQQRQQAASSRQASLDEAIANQRAALGISEMDQLRRRDDALARQATTGAVYSGIGHAIAQGSR